MVVSHLYVFSGEMSVQIFGPFFDWAIYFSGIELQEFLYVCESLLGLFSLVKKFISVFRFHLEVIPYDSCLALSPLLHLLSSL